MEIEDLRTFVEVADAGGINSAARRLGLAKSIVSRRLLRLEEELGAELLARTTRSAVLTEAGISFRDQAADICAKIDAAREEMSPNGDIRGLLRIAGPASVGTYFASVLADFARRHPALNVHTWFSDQYVDLAAEGFDCAIRVGYLADSNLIARRVGPLYGKLVASPDYVRKHGEPKTPAEIVDHQALMQGTEAWQFLDGEKTITVYPRGRFKADNAVALTAAALAGLGIGWLPDGITGEHIASGALVPVMTRYPPPPAGIYVIRPPGQHPSRKVRVLTEMLIDCFEHTRSAG